MGKFSRHTKEKAEDLPLSSIDKSGAKISPNYAVFTYLSLILSMSTLQVTLFKIHKNVSLEFSKRCSSKSQWGSAFLFHFTNVFYVSRVVEEDLEWNFCFSCIFCLTIMQMIWARCWLWVLLLRKMHYSIQSRVQWLNYINVAILRSHTLFADIAFQSWKISGNEFTNNNWMPEGPFTKINYSICTLATQHFSRQIGKHCSAISFHRVEERDKEAREIISLFF